MKNIKKKISALVLTTVFASMQVSACIDTGLGVGNGGAVINTADGGFIGVTTGTNSATLNFDGSSHVNWNTLNVNSGETLNFNATNGASNITVLNTVNTGMSKIYGNINSNGGIGQLIISNPNGVLFDGAHFTTAGDLLITTGNPDNTNLSDKQSTQASVISIKDSNFAIGGEFNLIAPTMNVARSAISTGKGFKLTTIDGQDYAVSNSGSIDEVVNNIVNNEKQARVTLEAVSIDGNVYITAGKGTVKTTNGGKINGNLRIDSDGDVVLNYNSDGKVLEVTGDIDAKANGIAMYARNVNVGGNLNMKNGGGFLEVGNVNVGKNMDLITTNTSTNYVGNGKNKSEVKHFVHVIGNNTIKGNANITSTNNIHIGGYNYAKKQFAEGSLNVGGNLTAHAIDGHVLVTVDTTADTINLMSEHYNILTDGKARLTANEYKFSSNGYIGGIADYTREDGTVLTKEDQIIGIMENYIYIPNDIQSHTYIDVTGKEELGGAKITKINTPGNAYIRSHGNITVTGANAQNVNITAPNSRIDITGPDVHAQNFNIGYETDTLKLDFEGRDFTTNYTNIRDEKVTTIRPDEVITYELTNEPENGYNSPKGDRAENTTYLIGPDKNVDPDPDPVDPDPDPVDPDPDPVAPDPIDPDPDPTPDPVLPDSTENARNLMTHWTPEDITASPVNTPVAFAADLDDDEIDKAVRKNVDGSVTVVRAFAVGK